MGPSKMQKSSQKQASGFWALSKELLMNMLRYHIPTSYPVLSLKTSPVCFAAPTPGVQNDSAGLPCNKRRKKGFMSLEDAKRALSSSRTLLHCKAEKDFPLAFERNLPRFKGPLRRNLAPARFYRLRGYVLNSKLQISMLKAGEKTMRGCLWPGWWVLLWPGSLVSMKQRKSGLPRSMSSDNGLRGLLSWQVW